MEITKYEHSCMKIERNGSSVIIDPGNFTNDLVIPNNVEAIFVTHSHQDHVDSNTVKNIITHNPKCNVFAHQEVADSLPDDIKSYVTAVNVDDEVTAAGFGVKFTGGIHAEIHSSMRRISNLGILVDNGSFFYPGDMLDAPNIDIDVLALPVSAPWMKISETMNFFKKVNPKYAFPVHDAILSQVGKSLVDNMLTSVADAMGTKYRRIKDTQSEEF